MPINNASEADPAGISSGESADVHRQEIAWRCDRRRYAGKDRTEKFKEYAEEQKLEPIGRPVMTDLHRHAGEGAHFKISYEVKPEFDLQDYAGIEVEQPVYSISDKDVDERIHYLRFNFSTREEVMDIKDIETIINITFQEQEPGPDGALAPPQTTDVYLYDPQVVPELRDALLGKKQVKVLRSRCRKPVTIRLPRKDGAFGSHDQ